MCISLPIRHKRTTVKHTLNLETDQPVAAFCEKTRLSYIETGTTGPTVVLLHGWSAFKELWWSTLLALAPYAQAYAPDMPGHGDSPLLSSTSMRQIAERIELAADHQYWQMQIGQAWPDRVLEQAVEQCM